MLRKNRVGFLFAVKALSVLSPTGWRILNSQKGSAPHRLQKLGSKPVRKIIEHFFDFFKKTLDFLEKGCIMKTEQLFGTVVLFFKGGIFYVEFCDEYSAGYAGGFYDD